jgi:hypothetical protein
VAIVDSRKSHAIFYAADPPEKGFFYRVNGYADRRVFFDTRPVERLVRRRDAVGTSSR